MFEKNILSELFRINELMGTKKSLILEESPWGRLATRISREIKDRFKNLDPNTRVVTSSPNRDYDVIEVDIEPGFSRKMLRKDVPQISDFFEGNKSFDDLTLESKKVVLDIFEKKGMLKDLYEDWLTQMMSQGNIYSETEFFQKLNTLINSTRPKMDLKQALGQIVGDDLIAEKMLDYVRIKKGHFDNNKLVVTSDRRLKHYAGKKTKEFMDVDAFDADDISKLMSSSVWKKFKDWLNRNKVDSQELQRLMKSLENKDLTQEQKKFIESEIYNQMETLYLYERNLHNEIENMMGELSSDNNFKTITDKYKAIKDKYGKYGSRKIIIEELSPLKKEWEAIKQAWDSTGTLSKLLLKGPFRLVSKLKKLFKEEVKDIVTTETENKVLTVEKPGMRNKLKNYLAFADERGFPTRGKENKFNPYEALIEMGGMPLAKRSYYYKLILQVVRNMIVFTISKVIAKSIINWVSNENKCLPNLKKVFLDNGVQTILQMEEFMDNSENYSKLPPCFLELNALDQARLLTAVDYILIKDPTLEEKQKNTYQKIWEQLQYEFQTASLSPWIIDDILVTSHRLITLQSVAAIDQSEKMEEQNNEAIIDNSAPPTYLNNADGFKSWLSTKSDKGQFRDFKDGKGYTTNESVYYVINDDKQGFGEKKVEPEETPDTPTTTITPTKEGFIEWAKQDPELKSKNITDSNIKQFLPADGVSPEQIELHDGSYYSWDKNLNVWNKTY